MSFSRLWRNSTKKGSSSQDTRDFALFSQLTYMSAIAASGVERNRIFEYASQHPFPLASYFERIELLARQLNYDYAEACRLIGESVKQDKIKSLLLRFAAALSSGEREEEFLSREARVQAETYSNKYRRDLERLGAWTYAFAGLVVSAALIVIITLISSMIFPAGASITLFVTIVMGLTILVTLLGAWFIYLAAPREVKFYSPPQKSPGQRTSRAIFQIALSASLALGIAMAVSGADTWIILLICGIMVFPVGLVGLKLDRQVDSKDKELGTFFRSLGGITAAIGMTIKEGLDKLDIRSLPSLKREIERLRYRMGLGLKPDACWERFSAEIGSEMGRHSSEMFSKATNLGGEINKIGEQISSFTTTVFLLRERRKMISGAFLWLSVGMHIVTVALLVFVVELARYFAGIVQGLQQEMQAEAARYLTLITGNIFLFNFSVAEYFPTLVIPVVLVLSLVNAFVPQATEGGHWYKFLLYLSITLMVSGLALWGIPPVVNWIFSQAR